MNLPGTLNCWDNWRLRVIFIAVTCVVLIPGRDFASSWSTDPAANNAICTTATTQRNVFMASDGAGGAILVWEDFRNGIDYDLYAQRVNANGQTLWEPGGVAICATPMDQVGVQLVSDDAGGAILSWYDKRNGTDFQIFAQRVNGNGQTLWTENGDLISAGPAEVGGPLCLTIDGSGGAIVAWEDIRNSVANPAVYAQRVDANGQAHWTPGGEQVCPANGPQYDPALVGDGNGGAIFAWEDGRDSLPFNLDFGDIYAQHLDADAVPLWTVDGVAVCTATATQALTHIVGDISGDAVITWQDLRDSDVFTTLPRVDIYGQKLNQYGDAEWANNGVLIGSATATWLLNHDSVADGNGGAILTWADNPGSSATVFRVIAQRVGSNGAVHWNPDGVIVCTSSTIGNYPRISADGGDGAIIAWQDSRVENQKDIFGQRIDESGATQWPTNGVPICAAPFDQAIPQVLSDGFGDAIVAWEDMRNGVDRDIFASRVKGDGSLGQTDPVTQFVDSTFTTSPGNWTQFGVTNSKQSASYDGGSASLLAHVNSVAQENDYRIVGWLSSANDTIHYASVGSGNFLRAKFHVYATGQTGTALNEIPNFRVRIASRFAYSAILQPFNHDNSDPEGTALAQDIRPSTSPIAPSTYRVDLDPADVPQLVNNQNTESFLRLFEAYEGGAQAQGDLGLVESTIGIYPALRAFDDTSTVPVTQNGLIKSYRPGPSDGGDFGHNTSVNTPGITSTSNGAITVIKSFNGSAENSGPMPGVTINNIGVTLETLAVPSDRYGACALDTFGDITDQTSHTARARIQPGKQYRVRFHATSTKQSNTQALIRFRARSLKFLYTANLEVGSSQALPPTSTANAAIAAQSLPGIGNQLPTFDRINPTENGGWYSVLMVTPMNPDIQPDQPNLYAQDPPGIDTSPANNSKSRRDIQFGFDIIDTFSTQPTSGLESGQMTVDRVDIQKYDLVPD